ncbi:MAG: Holliday junction branch migration protein RuvA [Rhodospirillales bacterium]|nr:MAG: Holliday junction branch migration protein RuvA [Rhodospirillales bacterium]
MIASLSGRVDSIADGFAVIDVGGVGYLVFCSARTLAGLDVGTAVRLRVDTVVRDDGIHLYGFAEEAEQQWFRLLNTVQAVGGRAALALLSVLPPDALALSVAAGDRQALTRAPGVGPRLAARIIAELKDKVGSIPVPATASTPATAPLSGDAGDAVAALVNLGFRPGDALSAVAAAARQRGPGAGVETLVRDGLAALAPQGTPPEARVSS